MITVTRTFLPPQEEYHQILEQCWLTGWMTNRGPLVQQLEEKLKMHLGVSHLLAMTNGTLPLQIAIRTLELTGEIITTPFSYVATTSSIVWEQCTPVFVDVNQDHLTIDESKIEAAITPKTSAILATHVFGNPCDVDTIEKIAKRHGLRVIYDAAHCFGVTYNGKSMFEYGDISTCSFHATKLFHTGEGGALFTANSEWQERAFYLHNFGHMGKEAFAGLGINGKMSELQAAMGLAVLPYMDEIVASRKSSIAAYKESLNYARVVFPKLREGTQWNYSYLPVIFETEQLTLEVKQQLEAAGIYPRRYFYPSLNTLPYVGTQNAPISEQIAATILCLPLFYNMENSLIQKICTLINKAL